jgi:hypothetical protein
MTEDKKLKKEEKEKISEVFEINKDGKEEIIEKDGVVREEVIKKGQKESENKILLSILLCLGFLLLIVFLYFLAVRSSTHFKYDGVKFAVLKQGELTFYQTSFPVMYKGNESVYNIYLRNDPRKLDRQVPAPKEPLDIANTVVNITENFDCNGDQVIAIANLVNLYGAIGKKIIKDENASCDLLGRYMYITIESGNETKVEKVGPNCYNIDINNCEILQGTERFIAEMLVKINSDNALKQ